MSKEREPANVTAENLVRCIDNEGLGYAVASYYGRDILCVDDPKLEELWKQAFDAIYALEVRVDDIREKLDKYEDHH